MFSWTIVWVFPQPILVTMTRYSFPFLFKTKLDRASTLVTSRTCLISPWPSCPRRFVPKVKTSYDSFSRFLATRTVNYSPAFMSTISELSRALLIFTGVNAAIKGEFICENYSSCDNCRFEFDPQPYRLPLSSKARLWYPPAAIFLIFLREGCFTRFLQLWRGNWFFVRWREGMLLFCRLKFRTVRKYHLPWSRLSRSWEREGDRLDKRHITSGSYLCASF